MGKDLSEYVCLDGVYVREEQVVKMAGNAGSFAVAEHYLCALLAHGLMYGKTDIINKVNEVRERYQVLPFAKPENQGPRNEYGRSRVESVEIKVRKIYSQMTPEHQKEVMRSCLQLLRAQTDLFCHKNDWLSVMLVVRDRLDGNINQNNFADYARRITPEDWPASLCISDHTPKNFSRLLAAEDRMEAYYDMEENPQARLCDKLWEIVIQAVLTEIP
jgi:hypothetical protein